MREDNTPNTNDDFKGNFNFSNLLEKNEKKNAKSPIANLLQSTTQSIVDEDKDTKQDLTTKINELERRFENKEVNEKFERLESLLQSVIINQNNQPQIEFTPSVEKNNSKLAITLTSIIATALVLSAIIISGNKEKEIVTKIKEVKVQAQKVNYFTPTKYLNLRAIPSTKGEKLEVVAPNTQVEIKDTKGKWILIEFKNFLKGTTHQGWVYDKQNLKPI